MSQDVNITIGGSLKALQWAYQHGTKLIINELSFPPPYEPPNVKLAWGLLYYKLMMDGKLVGGDNVNGIKINDDDVFVVCKNNVVNKLAYDKITLFDDKNIIGLPDIKKEIDQFTVIDTMRSVSFVFKDTSFSHTTGDNFVKEIYVQKDYVNSPAQIWVLSKLNKQELNDFDFSDTMAKFKTETTLKEIGFTGNFMKRDEVVLEVVERSVQTKMNAYEDTEKINFIYE